MSLPPSPLVSKRESLLLCLSGDADKDSAYFGAYFIGPLTYSGWIVRKFGYRWTFITGLCIYGVGALLFWPSGVKRSFGGFCGAMFVVGSGLSTLETSANPFIVSLSTSLMCCAQADIRRLPVVLQGGWSFV
jgi:FHS family L-fucose permease-like MFS transporter